MINKVRTKLQFATQSEVGHKTYNVVMRISPIKSLEENRENVASCEDIYHQCMLAHPFHNLRNSAISTYINLQGGNKMRKKKNSSTRLLKQIQFE